MICTVCGVWYDPQEGCDHRVLAMNRESKKRMSKRLKKHTFCSPDTLEELKKHIEYGKCNPIVSKRMFYDLITRIQNIEEELDL